MKKHLKAIILLAAVAVALFSFERKESAQQNAIAPAATASVIPAPAEARLKWENLRLRASNLRLQADALDKQAQDELEAMNRTVGEKYTPRLNQQTQELEFVLKVPVQTQTAGDTVPTVPKKKD